MSTPQTAEALAEREAVQDALHRCILGLDSNDRPLWESSMSKSEETCFVAEPIMNVQGWDNVNTHLQRVFELVTMHITSNVRVQLKSANTASLTCHTVSYHVEPENAYKMEETSFTGYSLYDIDLVKDEGDGMWKIQKWRVKVIRTTGDPATVGSAVAGLSPESSK
ncbi:unnamed protein product [Periconia digitata]|uniref:SnoaL-like domain-containing protein n=1 Tax=Periconia digitata TaxID=1303443 RepID=A0A9W4U955_9PLEO|nr:unnamed protein product [Periconia digitata]